MIIPNRLTLYWLDCPSFPSLNSLPLPLNHCKRFDHSISYMCTKPSNPFPPPSSALFTLSPPISTPLLSTYFIVLFSYFTSKVRIQIPWSVQPLQLLSLTPSLLLPIFFCSTEAWNQDLHLKPLYQPFFVMGFFQGRILKLFAQAGFKQRSSWSMPLELLRFTGMSHQRQALLPSLLFITFQYILLCPLPAQIQCILISLTLCCSLFLFFLSQVP
jgi:hypothetical protein